MIEFTAGQFVPLRATTQFHLGMIERDIVKGEVVEFDGTTLKIGDAKHNIAAVRAAVKAGWLVPADDTTAVYRPTAAQVNVSPATTVARDRGEKVQVQTVLDEERDLGNLKRVRDRGDGIVKKAMTVVNEEASSEGVAVGKLARPTHSKVSLTTENEMRLRQEVNRIDNVQGTPDKRVIPIKTESEFAEARVIGASASRAGDAISELLGDDEGVVVGRLPPVGRNPLGEGDSPHLTASEKEERAAEASAAVEQARAARVAAANASAAKLGLTPKAPEPAPAAEAEIESLPADLGQKVAFVRAVIPTFEWDMTRPWKTRVVDAVKRYGKNPLYLNGILSVETDTVKAHIAQALTPKS